MPPTTSRDFQKVAAQRLLAAETLQRDKMNLDAQYVGGYTVECTLKALILELTPDLDKSDMLKKITSGATMHKLEVLLGKVRELSKKTRGFEIIPPPELAQRMRRFNWTTDLRYEIGRRDTGETIGFLKTAKAIYEWVEEQLT